MTEFSKEELLSAYLDGELSADERARVEKLLAEDASARAMLDELRAVSAAVKGLAAFKLDEDIGSRVLKIAERRMLGETPSETSDIVAESKSTPVSFWKTAARRFFTPRTFAWSATAIAVAIILTVYGPEEEKPAVRSPIAMDMPSDSSTSTDGRLAEGSARRGHGEFRAAPPVAAEASPETTADRELGRAIKKNVLDENVTNGFSVRDNLAAPAEIAEKPAAPTAAAAPHPAAIAAAEEPKSAPAMKSPAMDAVAEKKVASGAGMGERMGGGMRKDGAPGMAAGTGINGPAMPGMSSLADKKSAEIPKGKSAYNARSTKSFLEGESPGEGFQYGAETREVTVRCYYVSSLDEARKSLQKILLAQKPPLRKLQEESLAFERKTVQSKAAPPEDAAQLVRPKKADGAEKAQPAHVSIEATPAQLKLVLAEIGKQSAVFRECAIDAYSAREEQKQQEKGAMGLEILERPQEKAVPQAAEKMEMQQAAPQPAQQQVGGGQIAARQSGDVVEQFSTLEENAKFRIVFILQADSKQKQNSAAPNSNGPEQ